MSTKGGDQNNPKNLSTYFVNAPQVRLLALKSTIIVGGRVKKRRDLLIGIQIWPISFQRPTFFAMLFLPKIAYTKLTPG